MKKISIILFPNIKVMLVPDIYSHSFNKDFVFQIHYFVIIWIIDNYLKNVYYQKDK